MLHEHVAYCNSPAFQSLIYSVIVDGTCESTIKMLDMKPDAQLSAQDAQAHDSIVLLPRVLPTLCPHMNSQPF